MVEFYGHFSNLSPDQDFSSTFFGPPFLRFREGGHYEEVDEDHPDPHGEWADAYYLFCDGAGHKVLMKDSGEVGWSVVDESRSRVSGGTLLLELPRKVCDLFPRGCDVRLLQFLA